MGGLSKKAFLIKGLVADPRYSSLILNSGNMLFKTDVLPPENLETAQIAADGIAQAMRKMGGTLAGVGTRDLTAGASFLQHYQNPPSFTWLSLNVVDPANKNPIFTPILRQQRGGLNIAVLALTDHTAFKNKPGALFQAISWQETLHDALVTAQQGSDFILLLSNYSFAENKEIARNYGAIDLILQSGHAIGNITPILINQTLISQTETRGKYLGVMDIDWNGHGRWSDVYASGHSAEQGQKPSTYSNRFIALKPSMTNDPEIEALVRHTRQAIERHRNKQGQ